MLLMAILGLSIVINIILAIAVSQPEEVPWIRYDSASFATANKWRDVCAAQHRGLQRQARQIHRLKGLVPKPENVLTNTELKP